MGLVFNVPTCSRTGVAVDNCRCGGHVRNTPPNDKVAADGRMHTNPNEPPPDRWQGSASDGKYLAKLAGLLGVDADVDADPMGSAVAIDAALGEFAAGRRKADHRAIAKLMGLSSLPWDRDPVGSLQQLRARVAEQREEFDTLIHRPAPNPLRPKPAPAAVAAPAEPAARPAEERVAANVAALARDLLLAANEPPVLDLPSERWRQPAAAAPTVNAEDRRPDFEYQDDGLPVWDPDAMPWRR